MYYSITAKNNYSNVVFTNYWLLKRNFKKNLDFLTTSRSKNNELEYTILEVKPFFFK